jgi:type III secretion system FlhB-like substrate exporter
LAAAHSNGTGLATLVAEGEGRIAAKILATTQQHGVPIHHDAALARSPASIWGEQIPTELFSSVATMTALVAGIAVKARAMKRPNALRAVAPSRRRGIGDAALTRQPNARQQHV